MGSGLHELTITEPVARAIFDVATSHEGTLACCLLPDRLEWLLRSGVDVDAAVEALVDRTVEVGRRLGIEEPLWTAGSGPGGLSVASLPVRAEGIEEAVQKIQELPVREGHVSKRQDWPYSVAFLTP
jgi:hypothetical protein